MQVILDHFVLNMEDDGKMITFYTQVLGLAADRLEAYHAGQAPFPSVRLNADTIIDLFPKSLWQKSTAPVSGPGHLNHFCFALQKKRWDALVARLKENHVAIEEGPVPRWGAHGTGVSIYFRDPEDNLIEARYYEGADDTEPCRLTS